MSKIGWIIFTTVVIGLLAGLVVWTRVSNPPLDLTGIDNNSIVAPSNQNGNIGDRVAGNKSSEILFVEYADFQCPSCGASAPQTTALREKYGDDVAFVFRNFPITSIHPNARIAAAVAEAAGLQGKYWEMHDLLFERQDSWESLSVSDRTGAFEDMAKTLELNLDIFREDVASSAVSDKIEFDQALAKASGVSATPTFFINGVEISTEAANGIVQGDTSIIERQLDELIK